MAFAVEDSVELIVSDSPRVRGEPAGEKWLYRGRVPIEGDDYFVAVRDAIGVLFQELYDHQSASLRRGELLRQFGRVQRVVVSCVGVIADNSRLVQLPLWHWPTFSEVTWYYKGKRKVHFDFREEILDALEDVASANKAVDLRDLVRDGRAAFARRIVVVNDLAACATAEFMARPDTSQSLVYVRAHNGINVGVATEAYQLPPFSTEAGHLYPMKHDLDREMKFEGVCPFHIDCIEGMVSVHALLNRATPGRVTNKPYEGWTRYVTETDGSQGALGRAGRKKFEPAGQSAELVAHYIAQLVYAVVLFPASPNNIVLGGCLVNEEVLGLVRSKVVQLMRGYPLRGLRRENVEEWISESVLKEDEHIEVEGALAIAARPRPKLV